MQESLTIGWIHRSDECESMKLNSKITKSTLKSGSNGNFKLQVIIQACPYALG